MLADKIKFVTDKFVTLMPPKDASTFRNLMYKYVALLQNGSTNLPAPNTNNKKMNELSSAILNSLAGERMNPSTPSSGKYYGTHSRSYWNYPWYWNYWYYNWSPYYWWSWDPNPYDGISYVGGAKKVGSSYGNCDSHGTGVLDNIIDSAVDIQSMNLNCDERRVCDFNVRFTKAPLHNQSNALPMNANDEILLDLNNDMTM